MGANDIKASGSEEINFQHFKSDIEKCENCKFMIARDGKLKECNGKCYSCIFAKGGVGCHTQIIKWGLSKYEPKPIYKITAFEHEFLKQAYNRGCTDVEVPESKSIILLTQKIGKSSELTEPIGNDIFKLFSNFDKHRHSIKEILDNHEIMEEENNENN